MEDRSQGLVLKNLQTAEETQLVGVIRIGRVRENTIVINDENASRFHAIIWTENHTLYIRDEGSTNGTLVNGEQIQQPTVLTAGAHVQVGNARFVVEAHPVAEPEMELPAPASSSGVSFPWVPVAIAGGVILLAIIALLFRSDGGQASLLPTVTPSSEPVISSTVAVSPTVTPTALSSPTETATPLSVAATPKSSLIYPAPSPLQPTLGARHVGNPGPVLAWSSQGDLNGNEYYRIVIDYPHEGQSWQEVGWSQASSWQVPDYLLLLLSGPNDCRWSVQVMQVTARDAAGRPTDGEALSPRSEQWEFVWVAEENPLPPAPTPTAEFRP